MQCSFANIRKLDTTAHFEARLLLINLLIHSNMFFTVRSTGLSLALYDYSRWALMDEVRQQDIKMLHTDTGTTAMQDMANPMSLLICLQNWS
jgi:hypothetical protein